GIYDSSATHGTAIAGSGALTLKVTGTPWAPNQWRSKGDGVQYSVINTTQTWPSVPFNKSASIGLGGNTTNTITTLDGQNDHGQLSFKLGDAWQIRRAITCIDQPGRGQDAITLTPGNPPSPQQWPQQALEPIYVFNNTNDFGNSWTFSEAS